jgi:hypothetical protein
MRIGRPKANMDGCRKSRPPLRFDRQTVRPVTSRYTDDIPANKFRIKGFMTHEFFNENVKNQTAAKTVTVHEPY